MASIARREPRVEKVALPARHGEGMDRSLVAQTAVHELREPVQAIMSFLCVLLEERTGPLSDLQRDFLATADQATRRLKRRIDDLQLVMAEQAELTIRPEATDLLLRVSECCHELSQIADSHSVQITLETDRATRRSRIWADPDRVDQILLNLIENAVHYSVRGSTVGVSVRSRGTDGWSVTVQNTASETVNEDPSSWFMPLTRGQNGIALRSNGQGLGLAAAEKLARAQGGNITASVHGHTVEVTVSFPAWHPTPVTHLNGHDSTFVAWGDL